MTAVYNSYPELTREAIKQGTFVSGLRYWETVSVYGNFTFPISVRLFRQFTMEMFDICRRHVYRILTENNGRLWDYTPGTRTQSGTVRIYSPDEVAKAYGLKSPGPCQPRSVREILSRGLAGTYAALREHYRVLASPMTRKNWQDFTGVKIRSQYNHERTLGIELEKNFLLVDAFGSLEECQMEFDLRSLEHGPYRIAKKRVFDSDGNLVCIFQGIFREIGGSWPGTKYRNSSDSNLLQVGRSLSAGIWIERGVCCKLQTHHVSSLTITGGRDWVPELAGSHKLYQSLEPKMETSEDVKSERELTAEWFRWEPTYEPAGFIHLGSHA